MKRLLRLLGLALFSYLAVAQTVGCCLKPILQDGKIRHASAATSIPPSGS
jgi:hypothetical protein